MFAEGIGQGLFHFLKLVFSSSKVDMVVPPREVVKGSHESRHEKGTVITGWPATSSTRDSEYERSLPEEAEGRHMSEGALAGHGSRDNSEVAGDPDVHMGT